MSLPSEMGEVAGNDGMNVFRIPESSVAPFEFRLLCRGDSRTMLRNSDSAASDGTDDGRGEWAAYSHHDAAAREETLRHSTGAARQEGFEDGEREGRRALRLEQENQLSTQVARERDRVTEAVHQFRGARDRYFAEVEQEVVKLALAVAARVLHREAQLDPLLLTGAVRVALEKMADRSAVVLRVAGADVEAWERSLLRMQPNERPSVMEDAQMERGECVLETTMGTVELGVQVQLQEIEKGFFDLLNHRPTA